MRFLISRPALCVGRWVKESSMNRALLDEVCELHELENLAFVHTLRWSAKKLTRIRRCWQRGFSRSTMADREEHPCRRDVAEEPAEEEVQHISKSAVQHIRSTASVFVTQQRCLKYRFYTCFYFTSNDRRKHSVDTIACIFTTLEGGTPQREVKRARGWHFALQKECVMREKRKIGK